MESSDTKTGRGIGPLLRELRDILFEPATGDRTALLDRTSVSVERMAQVTGLQALLIPIVAAPLLLLAEPTGPVGDVGWVLALGGIAVVIAIGAALIRSPAVSVRALAFANAFTATILAMLAWLSGGFGSPFPILFPLLASSITPYRPQTRRILIGWLLLCVSAPVFYEDTVTGRDVAEVLMIGAASVATFLTMVWLSTRASRSEAGLMDAISTAKLAQEELAAEADRLMATNEERDRLVTRVAHELRTPLTCVKGYVDALIAGEGGELDPAQRELATVALRNTVRLELLVADLVLLSRAESGQLELRPGTVEIAASLKASKEDLEQLAREGGVNLIVEATPGLEWDIDQERFEQATANLISNAIKYSPGGGPVLIRARQAGTELWVEIIDKGVGIPENEINQLGVRFFRASTAGTVSGTGLGIAITKDLVELHRGSLEVESEVGSGSTFRIRIPQGLSGGSLREAEGEAHGLE
jgi:signal transduction histidine kinase